MRFMTVTYENVCVLRERGVVITADIRSASNKTGVRLLPDVNTPVWRQRLHEIVDKAKQDGKSLNIKFRKKGEGTVGY